jgi:hypothetical protein
MVHAETYRVLRSGGWVVGARLLAPHHPLVSLRSVVGRPVADPAWPWVVVVDVAESSLAVAIFPLGK